MSRVMTLFTLMCFKITASGNDFSKSQSRYAAKHHKDNIFKMKKGNV